MRIWNKATLKSLMMPGGILVLMVVALASSGWLTLAAPALGFLFYCAIAGGMLLAWRFHSSRIFFVLAVLLLANGAMVLFGAGHNLVLVALVKALAVLVPIDYVLIAFMHEGGFTAPSTSPLALLLFAELIMVAAISRVAESKLTAGSGVLRTVVFPRYVWVVLGAAFAALLVRFLLTRRPTDSALVWSLLAFCLSLEHAPNERLAIVYLATSACVLLVSIIENSYLLAYHDELTTLPSRRAFNDALPRLQEPFSMAVVDIDHFKRFNDTYGHDTGDQVLRLVASKLAGVTGGGCAYRCGGEEFTILFPGKGTSEVVEHLERLRESVASAEFRMRGNDRRQIRRGADRRNEGVNQRSRKSKTMKGIVPDRSDLALSVTVSIGVASSAKKNSDPEAVLESADKALYRAKANGRNRVETASQPRRPSAKAAGMD